MIEERIRGLDKMITEATSPVMKQIYEKAKTLPPVISQGVSRQSFDDAWEGYIEDIRDNTSEVRIGTGMTIFRGDGNRNLGDIAHEVLHRKSDI